MTSPLRSTTTRIVAIGAAAWLGYAVVRAGVRLAMIPRPPHEALLALARSLLEAVFWAAVTPVVLALTSRFPWRKGTRRQAAMLHLTLASLAVLLHSLWTQTILGWTGVPMELSFVDLLLSQVDQSLFFYAGLVAVATALEHGRRLGAARLRSSALNARLAQARLEILALQLQPHFLFNTLNAVTELVHRDIATARRMLHNLQALLRDGFGDSSSHTVPLSEELALLAAYVEIQTTRFEGTLGVDLDTPRETLPALVPRLVMQPLVENAIRHGTSRRASGGRITISARRRGESLVVEVSDNGPAAPGASGEGIGLGNTRRRLELLYGADQKLGLTHAPGRGTTAVLEIPWTTRRPLTPDGSGDGGPTIDRESEVPPAGAVPRQAPSPRVRGMARRRGDRNA